MQRVDDAVLQEQKVKGAELQLKVESWKLRVLLVESLELKVESYDMLFWIIYCVVQVIITFNSQLSTLN